MMNFLMLSCKKATELIEKKSLFKLTLAEKVQLRMHISVCDACKDFEKQSGMLDTAIRYHYVKRDASEVPQTENKPLKKKIISKLK